MTTMKLYEISELERILEQEEDLEVKSDLQEVINMELERKAEGIYKGIKNLESNIPAINAEIERLTKLRDKAEKDVAGIKGFILSYMIQSEKNEIKTPIGKFKIGKSTSTNVDETKLPSKAFVVETKTTIKRLSIKESEEMGLGEESGITKQINYKLNIK